MRKHLFADLTIYPARLPVRHQVQGVGHVLRLAVGQPGLVLAGENSQKLKSIASSPDRKVVTMKGRLRDVDYKTLLQK